MHNLFQDKPPLENLKENKDDVILPGKAEDHTQGSQPLIILPEYSGDFLEKLRRPFQGKPVEGGSDENLWDVSMPSEMLKHQEAPIPRVILDDWYEAARPGPGAGGDTLKDYWDRAWDPGQAPEISEDLLDRREHTVCDDPWSAAAMRVADDFLSRFVSPDTLGLDTCRIPDRRRSPDAGSVVANFLMEVAPRKLPVVAGNTRVAILLRNLAESRIHTRRQKEKGESSHALPHASYRVHKEEPHIGRWTFTTGSGGHTYTTVFQFKVHGNLSDPFRTHVLVSCNCPSWYYYGAQWNADSEHYLYGDIHMKLAPPDQKDPDRNFLVCKHILSCIPFFRTVKLEVIEKSLREQLRKIPRLIVEKPLPKEQIEIPPKLRNIVRQPDVAQLVREWPHMIQKRRNSEIMQMTAPSSVAFMAHRFPSTAAEPAVMRLREIRDDLRNPPSIRNQAKNFLRFWE